ncbi:hypothetical protein ACT17Q_13840 [Cellulomonas sp. CW35]|uniref:hypothetical protein n=1 Tax=Cellulomonas sp. CW35 TaxID=3458249 RepID=UPI004033B759
MALVAGATAVASFGNNYVIQGQSMRTAAKGALLDGALTFGTLGTGVAIGRLRNLPTLGTTATTTTGSLAAGGIAANAARSSRSVIDDVLDETVGHSGKPNLTSAHSLSQDEALDGGIRWLGEGYSEIGKPGSGVFRSGDGLRQFRMDNGSITGGHAPQPGHVHFEIYAPGGRTPIVNNHVPLDFGR